jgi:hypothetical protein
MYVSGTLTGWAIAYLMVHISGAKLYSFNSSPYPGQDSLQRVIIFGDMGKVVFCID